MGWGARAVLAPGICLAALVAGQPAAGAVPATRPLKAAAFTTRIPAGWPVVAFVAADGSRNYRIRTPATRFDDRGIPLPGGTSVFVSVSTPAQFASLYGAAPPRTPADLFGVFSTPADASEDVTLFDPARTALDREPALTETLGYRYREAFNVETDLVARHAGKVVVVSVATFPGRAGLAGEALRAVTGGWRWRTRVTGRKGRPSGGARYLGATTQGEVVALERTSRGAVTYGFTFFPSCPAIEIPGQADFETIAVSPTGRFEDRFSVAFAPDPDPAPVVRGRARPLLLVERARLAGRFLGPTLATGTLRDRVGVFDRGAFPAPGSQLDGCDTGPLTWRARRY